MSLVRQFPHLTIFVFAGMPDEVVKEAKKKGCVSDLVENA